ncbi:MAG: signal recognition particle-docking protein FtsY [Nitratireductor sp.]|nr:signal recognition particle-docking protein FtsY [Nitratireductor sp.]
MADKKPGLLKRMFSFGFGKKKDEAETVSKEEDAVEAGVPAAASTAEESPVPAAEPVAVETPPAEQPQPQETEEEAEQAARAAADEAEKARQEEDRKAAEEKSKAEAELKEAERKAAEKEKRDAEEKARKEAERLARAEAERHEAAERERLKQEEAARAAAAAKAKAETAAKAEAAAEAERQEIKRKEAAAAASVADESPVPEAEPISVETPPANQPQPEEPDDVDDESSPAGDALEDLEIEEGRLSVTERKRRKEPEPELVQDEEERRSGWLSRLSRGLSRSSNTLRENITGVISKRRLDDDTLQDLEDVLIQADLGIETAMRVTDALSDQKFGKEVTEEEVRDVMASEIEKILVPVAQDLELDLNHQPHVILVVGVNGSGKTTTIGKLSQKLYDAGFSTTLVAGDTFRAAAIEQLKIWGERTQSPVLFRPHGADAAGLVYDAWEEAKKDRRDVLLIDTAGRLQNRKELMAELEKIVRVLKKQDPSAPHTVLLTLDATTGQNAMNQVEIFKDVAGVNGLVMTKLDGTARGGILVAISAKHKLPVYFIGVGEQVADLEPFEARDFARSIAGLPKEE